jgi:hypothetical protein
VYQNKKELENWWCKAQFLLRSGTGTFPVDEGGDIICPDLGLLVFIQVMMFSLIMCLTARQVFNRKFCQVLT